MHKARIFALSATLAAAACVDQPMEAPVRAEPAPPQHAVIRPTRVELAVSGALVPGRPIQVTATVHPGDGVQATDVQIVAPEAAMAAAHGWRRDFRYDERVLPPLGEWSSAAAPGRSSRYRTTLQVPAPGFYRVGVRVDSRGSERPSRIVEEAWLLVDENGGRLTSAFDASLLPDSVQLIPGPFRTARPRTTGGGSSGRRTVRANTEPIPGYGQYNGSIGYYDYDLGQMRWYKGLVTLTYYESDYGDYYAIGGTSYESTSYGAFYYDCQLGYGEAMEIGADLVSGAIAVEPGTRTSIMVNSCYQLPQDLILTTPSKSTEVFLNMRAAADSAWRVFGRMAPRTWVVVEGSNWLGSSHYDKFFDRIHILESNVWGPSGAGTAAHEYGHAFHHKALGGIPGKLFKTEQEYYSCFPGHHFTKVTNYDCAYMEGWAEFFAAATLRSDAGSRFYDVRDGIFPQMSGTHGVRVEGAVASLFYDLLDNDAEWFDAVSLPGSYIADAVSRCQMHDTNDGWMPGFGADVLMQCMQRDFTGIGSAGVEYSTMGGYFTQREHSDASHIRWSSGYYQPNGWNQVAINRLWKWDLFGQ